MARSLLSVLGVPILGLVAASDARADGSPPPKLPDVLLVLDTSGSMQFALDGSGVPSSTELNRWATVVEGLTGTVHTYSVDSTGHVRSNACSAQANTADPFFTSAYKNSWDWPVNSAKPIDQRDPIAFLTSPSASGSPSTTCSQGPSGWDQSSDGIIDVFSRQVRFGLMTSDLGRLPGIDGSVELESDWIPKSTNSVGNDFSYWYRDNSSNWISGKTPAQGRYGNSVSALQSWEVGSRNPYARPYQGRLMGFGNPNASVDDVMAQNDRVQMVVLSQHPTALGSPQSPVPGDLAPMGAMLSDAYDFLLRDNTSLSDYPVAGASFLMSPATDPSFSVGCRKADVIVITDGRFGNDMRNPTFDGSRIQWNTSNPSSNQPLRSCVSGGTCPYQTADYYANQLVNNSLNPVPIQILGIAKHTGVQWQSGAGKCPGKGVSSGSVCTMNCEQLDSSDFGASGSTGKMCSGSPGAWDHNSELGNERPGVIASCCELANLAIQINPSKPPLYFIDNVAALKQALATIVAGIAGDTSAETEPVFASAAPTLNVAANPAQTLASGASLGPASFELLSSLAVAHGNGPSTATSGAAPMWRGVLERRRLTCSDANSSVAIAATVDASKGDDFANNLVKGYLKRQFFTVIAQNPSGVLGEYRTLRRNDYDPQLAPVAPNTDGLQGLETKLGQNQTPLGPSTTFGARIFSLIHFTSSTDSVLGIDDSSLSKCYSELGATDANTCADRVLRWYGGYRNNIPGHPNDRCPHSACSWVPVEYNNQSPLGAIYHSTPVTVSPPLDYSPDEAYRRDYAVAATAAKPNGQATRPTMMYAATIDGQLHAFVVAKNSKSNDPVYASVPNPDGVDNSGNNELWTFVPPAVLTGLWENFDSHAVLLDGPLAVSDVLVRRSANDAAIGAGKWKTILVGSGGASSAGGYYYALDVTNPLAPEFLWQLRTAGDSPVPLFGSSVPGAALATVGIKNSSGKVDQVGVAILSGGSSQTPPNNPTTDITRRRCGTCNTAGARTKIRNWGDSVAARSVTIVELATGRVLKRFEGNLGSAQSPGDLPSKDAALLNGLRSVRSANHPFDSPMTGTPVAFPNSPGVAALRAYVGDADGTLWRIDLHDSDPANWSVDIASDAYASYSGKNPELAGQPIANTPVLSTDESGNAVVVYATGDQDGFQTYAPGMKNYLVSVIDKASAKGVFSPTVSFLLSNMADGERVTGPLALFDQTLYFATFAPADPSATTCASGTAKVWGVNFLNGSAALDTDSTPGADAQFVVLNSGAVVFGAQINRVPSCSSAASSVSDGWLGGNFKTATNRSVGSYELVLQTGGADAFSTALGPDALLSTGQQGATTKSLHIKLATPKNTGKILSWASVVE